MSSFKPLAAARKLMGSEPRPGHGPWEEADGGYVDAKPYIGHTRYGLFEGYDGAIWKYYKLPEDVQINWLADPLDAVESQQFFVHLTSEFGQMLNGQPEKLRNDIRRPWHLQITQTPSKELQPYPGCTAAHADYLSRFSSQITKPIWHGYFGVKILPGGIFHEHHGFKAQMKRYWEVLKDPGALQWQIYAQDLDQTDALMARHGFRTVDFIARPEEFEQLTAWHGVSDATYGLPQQLQSTRFQEPVHGESLITPKWGEVTFHALKPHEHYNLSDPMSDKSRWAVPLYNPDQQVVLINMRGEVRATSVSENLLELKNLQRTPRKGNADTSQETLSQLDLIAAARQMVGQVHLPMLDNVEIIVGSRVPEDGSPHPLQKEMNKYGLMAAPLVGRQHLGLLASTPTYPRQVARIPRGTRKRPDLVNVMMPGVVAMSGVFRSTKPCADGGILVGLGDSSFQYPEIYTRPDGHYENNRTPGWLITGRPGAGKAMSLDTQVMTPSGPVDMGNLTVGDTVFGRDGKPCQVTFATEVMTDHEVFRITLSDGQTFLADADHQWLVSIPSDLYYYKSRDAAYINEQVARAQRSHDLLMQAAAEADPGTTIKLLPLMHKVVDILGEDSIWKISSQTAVRAALEFNDCPFVWQGRGRAYPLDIALKALAVRAMQRAPLPVTDEVPTRKMTTKEMYSEGSYNRLSKQQFEVDENGELTLAGYANNRRYSIPMAGAVQYPKRDLPVDPYVLGVWLGDGEAGTGRIGSGDVESCTDADAISDQRHILSQIQTHYPEAYRRDEYRLSVPGLSADLKVAGVLENKHVPGEYLCASVEQRLALLQGIMDTDGWADADQGYANFSNTNPRLVRAVVEIARSLGIKVTFQDCGCTGEVCECGRAVRTRRTPAIVNGREVVTRKPEIFVRFRTDLEAFRLPRKVVVQVRELATRSTSRKVVAIEPVASVPVRCISVDSADSTYLIGDSVPTSNTQQLLQIVCQLSYMGLPSFFLNPKKDKTLQPTFDYIGGHTISMNRAYLRHHPGQLDPCFFMSDRAEVAQILASSIFAAAKLNGNDKARLRTSIAKEIQDHATDLRNRCSADILFGNNHPDPNLRTEPISNAEVRTFVSEKMAISPFWTALIATADTSSELQAKMAQGRSVLVEWDSSMTLPPLEKDPENYDDSESDTVLSVTLVFQYGSAYIRGTGGAMVVDESWVLRASREARAILTRGGREWRQANIMLVLGTQNITDWLGPSAAQNSGVPMDSFFDRYLFMAINEANDEELDAFFHYSGLPRTRAHENYIRTAGVDKRRNGSGGRSVPVAYYVDRVHDWSGGVICGPWPALELNLGRTDKAGEAIRAAKVEATAAAQDAERARESRQMFGGSMRSVLSDQMRLDAEEDAEVSAAV